MKWLLEITQNFLLLAYSSLPSLPFYHSAIDAADLTDVNNIPMVEIGNRTEFSGKPIATTPEELRGTWKVHQITCNAISHPQLELMYQGSNQIQYQFINYTLFIELTIGSSTPRCVMSLQNDLIIHEGINAFTAKRSTSINLEKCPKLQHTARTSEPFLNKPNEEPRNSNFGVRYTYSFNERNFLVLTSNNSPICEKARSLARGLKTELTEDNFRQFEEQEATPLDNGLLKPKFEVKIFLQKIQPTLPLSDGKLVHDDFFDLEAEFEMMEQ